MDNANYYPVSEVKGYYFYNSVYGVNGLNISLCSDFARALEANDGIGAPYLDWLPGTPLPNPGSMHEGNPVGGMRECFMMLKVKELDLSLWDTSNISDTRAAFAYSNIQTLDLSGWNLNNLVEIASMFNRCDKLIELTFGKQTQKHPEKIKMLHFLKDCNRLEALDVSQFNFDNINKYNFKQIFADVACLKHLFVADDKTMLRILEFVPEACQIHVCAMKECHPTRVAI